MIGPHGRGRTVPQGRGTIRARGRVSRARPFSGRMGRRRAIHVQFAGGPADNRPQRCASAPGSASGSRRKFNPGKPFTRSSPNGSRSCPVARALRFASATDPSGVGQRRWRSIMADLKLVPPARPARAGAPGAAPPASTSWAGASDGAHDRGDERQGRRGQEHVAANLAVALGPLGARSSCLDGDLGAGQPRPAARPVAALRPGPRAARREALDQIVVEGPHGVRLVPAASGDRDLADLDDFRREGLLPRARRAARPTPTS